MYFLLFDKWKLLTYMATLVVVATTAQLHSKKVLEIREDGEVEIGGDL